MTAPDASLLTSAALTAQSVAPSARSRSAWSLLRARVRRRKGIFGGVVGPPSSPDGNLSVDVSARRSAPSVSRPCRRHLYVLQQSKYTGAKFGEGNRLPAGNFYQFRRFGLFSQGCASGFGREEYARIVTSQPCSPYLRPCRSYRSFLA
jgi:hypothetical protein